MIIVGGPVILLLLLLAFRPVRMIVGWLLFAVLCIGLYACAQMPPAHAQGVYPPDVMGMANRARGWQSTVPQIPDYVGCANRGDPWVMDNATGQCIRLSLEQLDQLRSQQAADQQKKYLKQRAMANDPRGDAAMKSFCASASPMSCMLFTNDVYACESRMASAGQYLSAIRNMEIMNKISPQQALNMMNLRDPWLARDAAEAPQSLGPTWFRVAELDNCLQAVVDRNRAQ